MFLSERIKKGREKKNMSRANFVFELAKYGLRISNPTVINWETAKTTPSADKIPIIALVLDQPVTYLLKQSVKKREIQKR